MLQALLKVNHQKVKKEHLNMKKEHLNEKKQHLNEKKEHLNESPNLQKVAVLQEALQSMIYKLNHFSVKSSNNFLNKRSLEGSSSHSRKKSHKSRSKSRSPSIPRRKGSPSFLERRRITRY